MSFGQAIRPNSNEKRREEVVEMSLKATLRENEVSCGHDPKAAGYRYPQWLISDELEISDRFPDLSQASVPDVADTSARIIALGLLEKYLDLYSNPFVRTAIYAGSFHIVEQRLDTQLNVDREVWLDPGPEDLLQHTAVHKPSGLACRKWGLIIAYMAKIAWFKTGHHLGGVALDEPLMDSIRAYFRVEGGLPHYVLQAIWHFSHLLDTRVACAHLGIIEMFDGCPPLDNSIATLPSAVLSSAREVFPCGTSIVGVGNEIFHLLTKSDLARYYRDRGTAQRIGTAYRNIRISRGSYHPSAHILGKQPKHIDIALQDYIEVSVIAHVLIPAELVSRWSDILPLNDVEDEPSYRYLNHIQKQINVKKPPPVPFSKPFVYKR